MAYFENFFVKLNMEKMFFSKALVNHKKGLDNILCSLGSYLMFGRASYNYYVF